uniref:L1 transposable element RRM domain-containing protein n=1 Tax=Fundulus heteroclitus TaxID=8078 RepID=A0A3Q2U4D8_FUNHE
MSKGKNARKSQKPDRHDRESTERGKLDAKLAVLDSELNRTTVGAESSLKSRDDEPQSSLNMANLETILTELRDFRQENSENLNEIKNEIKVANNRIDHAENRIQEAEERLQLVERATMELSELQKRLETRLVEQEGRSRRENIRIHGLKEGGEDGAGSVADFIEKLLREKLELPPSLSIQIERAHRALVARPSPGTRARSIVVKFTSFRIKEEILKKAWEKRGFLYEGNKVFLDHDYAPEVLKKRREYAEAKRVLKEKNIGFQTPFPAKMRVFYEGETKRGFPVSVIKPTESSLEKIRHLTWKTSGAQKGSTTKETLPGYKQRLQSFRRSQD